jgi:hypothetical protein
MAWSLLHRLGYGPPSRAARAALAAAAAACCAGGLRAPFLLRAPLQLASVLLAAASGPSACGAPAPVATPRCVAAVGAVQLGLGLAAPAALVWLAEGRGARRASLPHMQVKRVLLQP